MATYSSTGSEIETGDYVVYAVGPRDDWDWGRIETADEDTAEVSWYGSQTRTTTPLSVLARADGYTSRGQAEVAWDQACAAHRAGQVIS